MWGYIDEELRNQTARRAAFSASTGSIGDPPWGPGGDAPFESWKALKREVLRLVRDALGQRAESDCQRAVSTIAGSLVSPEIAASGGPVMPSRRVRPTKGGKETGDRHEVVACDPCLPREVWVTRCGWRFAGSSHAISQEGEVTCGKCLHFARIGGGAGRPAKRALSSNGG